MNKPAAIRGSRTNQQQAASSSNTNSKQKASSSRRPGGREQAAKTATMGGRSEHRYYALLQLSAPPSVEETARRSQSSKPPPAASVLSLQVCQAACQTKKNVLKTFETRRRLVHRPTTFENWPPTLRCHSTSDLAWPSLQTATAKHEPDRKWHATISENL